MTTEIDSPFSIVRSDETGEVYDYLLDAGEKTNGYLSLTVSGSGSGADGIGDARVEVRYGPLADSIIFTPQFREEHGEGGRKLICDELLSFRYVSVRVAAPERLAAAEFLPLLRDVEERGAFACDDAELEAVWRVARRTILLCMIPHRRCYRYRAFVGADRNAFLDAWTGDNSDWVLVDGSRRDREVWTGDLLPEIQAAWYAYGDGETIRNSLEVIACQQREDGFLPASSVSAQTFDEYCLWFIIVLREYLLLSGDFEYLERRELTLDRTISYMEKKLGEDGALRMGRRQTWAWTLSREGRVTSTNAVFVLAYRAAADLYRLLGRSADAAQMSSAAQRLSELVKNEAWDETIGAFRDTLDDTERYSLDGNCLALIAGIGDRNCRTRALAFLAEKLGGPYGSRLLWPPEPSNGTNWPHNEEVWPFAVQFEVEARFRAGRGREALGLMRICWANMLARGATTFWEIVDGATGMFMDRRIHVVDGADTWNSACHGWSAGVLYLMGAYVAGIRPDGIGFSTFVFDPQPSGLKKVAAAVPTPHGEIQVAYAESGGLLLGTLSFPKGTSLRMHRNGNACGPNVEITRIDCGEGKRSHSEKDGLLAGPGIVEFRLEP